MSEGQAPIQHGRESWVLTFARFITRNRFWIALLLVLSTLFWMYPIANTIATGMGYQLPGPLVRIDTNARSLFPDHRYIHAQDKFSRTFGSASLVAVAVVMEEGTIFRPDVIEAIREITRELDGIGFESRTDEREELRDQLEQAGFDPEEIRVRLDRAYPPYPVNHDQVRALTHPSTRIFQIEPDGAIEQDVLMKKLPKTDEDVQALRELVRQNPPVIFGRLVSRDEQGALITANFVTDRLSNRETYMAVFDHVRGIKKRWEEKIPGMKVYLSGEPIAVGWIITYAYQIVGFVIGTVILTFALLWLYFRRWHGVVIPMIAATMTTIWGLGFTGWMGITFDPLILVIPMITVARATSHTVQMAERFFEDYEIMLPRYGDPKRARIEVATVAMSELVVPGTLGIVTDVAGLMMIAVTSIQQMRDLAIFGSFWVTSIIITVEILHPILICYMPAPSEHEHFLPAFMVRTMRWVGWFTTHPKWKYVIGVTTVVLFVVSTYIALFYSKIGEAKPGTPLLWPDHEFNVATAEIATKFGGVDSLVVYADGDRPNASADADPIKAMERFERALKVDTNLGASISVVPFLRTFWQVNHYGDPKWYFVPDHPGTVRAVIFQLQQNGAPGFMRPFMTDDGRKANMQFFYPDHKGDTIVYATHFAEEFIKKNPLGEVIIRLEEDRAEPGAGLFTREKLTDLWYYMLGPLLPFRHHTMTVEIRQKDGSYVNAPVKRVSEDGLPDWIEEFRNAAVEDYVNERDSVEEGDFFSWPSSLENWETNDVGQWWESEEFGIRALEVQTRNLIVADMKAVESQPRFQPTYSWTRGVQFVMAGGSMGILAAINEEVERSHISNITLIFLVIFILHSFTYQSMTSGGIVFLQIATATMVSLAYMAIRDIGLNINTLPVQSVGVGIGVDYAIYLVDRIRHECVDTQDIDEAVRRALRTTGMAVSFTATTITGGILLWVFADLRFQAEMAYLLVMLMVLNLVGALTVVPAFYSILRPKVATALLTEEQREGIRIQKQREVKLGLRDADEK